MERCLALVLRSFSEGGCEADRGGAPGGEPLWHAYDYPASLFLSLVWPKRPATGGSRERLVARFHLLVLGSVFARTKIDGNALGDSREPPDA